MAFLALFAFATISSVDVWVNGYYRSDLNQTRDDNWSTKGNVNPHTGRRGNQ